MSINPTLTAGHWPDVARQWSQVGPPLRPSAQDLSFFRAAVQSPNLRALILGVTPELYHLPWPSGAGVLAIDHTKAMIDAIWPASPNQVICGEWTELPLQSASRDLVLCDGGFQLLSHPRGQARLVQMLYHTLTPGGRCVFRLFVPPPHKEKPQAVLADLLASKIPNLNILKLRLGMAMQTDPHQGVQLSDIWAAIHEIAPDFDLLATKLNWSLEHLLAINTYRNCPKRYHFVTVAEVRDLFCQSPGGFAFERMDVPNYELGERCPTIVFRRV